MLIADDHPVVRSGLCAVLGTSDDIEVVGAVENGRDAVAEAGRLRPDVILMDLMMAPVDGVEATRRILAERPQTRVIALTGSNADRRVLEVVREGALGYLSKASRRRDILRAIRRVHAGEPFLPPDLTRKLLGQLRPSSGAAIAPEPLSKRELEVLSLVAEGLSNQRIADRIHIAEATVRTHVSHILGKLGLSNRVEAALYALREGLASLEDAPA